MNVDKITKKILAGILTVSTLISVCVLASCGENRNDVSYEFKEVGTILLSERQVYNNELDQILSSSDNYCFGTIVDYEILPQDSSTKNLEFDLRWNEEGVFDPVGDYHGKYYAEEWAKLADLSEWVDVFELNDQSFAVLCSDTLPFPIDLTVRVEGTSVEATLQISTYRRVKN